MSHQCPLCQSFNVRQQGLAQRIGQRIGGAAGTATGVASAMQGASTGAAVGMVAGPAGSAIGSLLGALIGGGIGVWVASRMTGIKFWSFADALVPGLLLAQAFGRLGNWFNHELFGGPTTLPWGLEIESGNAAFPIGLPEGTLFHPTFLYEILWNLLGLVVLLWLERKLRPRWGSFFGMYLIWYGIGRFFIEGMRVDPSLIFLGLRSNQLTALLAVLVGIAIILVQRRRHVGLENTIYLPGRSNPSDSNERLTANPEEYFHVLGKK